MTVYAALDHRFRVRCDHVGLAGRIGVVLASLEAEDGDDRVATYELVADRPPPGPFELWLDGERLVRSEHPARPYARLLQQINREAARLASATSTVLHTAAAENRDGPVLLPAPMESGKSTLVTDLVRHGWGYLSDELASLDVDTGDVRGFPRAISLDHGSWRLFPELEPDLDPSTRERVPAQWQVPPRTIGRIGVDGGAPAAIVVHRYEPTLATALLDLDPVECLRRLIRCCFSFDAHVERDLAVLARALDRAPCYELTVGDLASARAALTDAFGLPRRRCRT